MKKGKSTLTLLLVIMMISALQPTATAAMDAGDEPQESDGMTNITITAGDAMFAAKLYDNNAAKTFLAQLPMTLKMSELNGNEKYCYLPDSLPTDSQSVRRILAGDLMLYGPDCLVLFYESFTSTYSYTKLGYIEDASGLADALGRGSVEISLIPKQNTAFDQ